MKKIISISFVVLAVMAVFASTVFAAPAGKNVTLMSVEYQPGGITLLFQTSGLTKADLKDNLFYADSNNQNMYCNFVDDTTTVRCTVSKKLAGKNFRATLAGFGFSGQLPQARSFTEVTTAACSEGKVLWYSLDISAYGRYFTTENITVARWDSYLSLNLDYMYKSYGYTYKITGSFCAPDTTAT